MGRFKAFTFGCNEIKKIKQIYKFDLWSSITHKHIILSEVTFQSR